MSGAVTFLIGLLVGMVLAAVAVVWGATRKDRRQLFWIDENYEIHLKKKTRW